jgi:hypothetical protein
VVPSPYIVQGLRCKKDAQFGEVRLLSLVIYIYIYIYQELNHMYLKHFELDSMKVKGVRL